MSRSMLPVIVQIYGFADSMVIIYVATIFSFREDFEKHIVPAVLRSFFWKLTRFVWFLQCMSLVLVTVHGWFSVGHGHWSWFSQVLVAAGKYHSLLVNENGNLFVCGTWIGVLDLTPAVTSTRVAPAQFCTQPAQRIVQISGSHSHAAFITETGEVSKNFLRV